MANSLIQFRIEEEIRADAVKVLNEIGLDLPTYLRICMKKLVLEQGVPFGLSVRENEGMAAFRAIQERARELGLDKMTLEEINEEIRQARIDIARDNPDKK